jgi:hypothetical protein
VGDDDRLRLLRNQPGPPPSLSDNFSAPLVDTETIFFDDTRALDHGWALAASVGVEGRARTGPLGFSVALAGLVPIVPARSDWGEQTSLDRFGVQLRAGVWLAIGPSRTAPAQGSRRVSSR